jgi:hypothetical protein
MTLPTMQVQWAQFAPDMSDYSPEYSDAINNVEPRADGYGPLPKLATFGTALPARCLGAYNFRRANGATDLFAGTATKLYRYNIATASWDDVTRLSGGNYAVSDGNYWNFTQFGSRLIAVNGSDATQYFDVDGGGANFLALPNAPIAKYVATIGDFLMFGNLSTNINAIAWSGINDSEYYTYGFRGSDTQIFPDGGFVQGIIPYGPGAIVFQRDKIRQLNRVQGNLVFTVSILHENIGCFAPQSIVRVRNDFFWYDQGGFFRGIEAQPIGAERVNRYTQSTGSGTYIKRMRGANDPVKQVVWWVLPTAETTAMMIGYDWGLDRWTQSTEAVDFIFPSITPGYTIDSIDLLFASMDEITIPFDSTFWQGTGVLAMAGFTYAGGFGYFQGFNQAATLETNDLYVNEGGKAFVQSVRMVSDVDHGSATVQIGTRPFHGEAVTWGSTAMVQGTSGRAWVRARGALHRFRVSIAVDATWNTAKSIIAYLKPAGVR